MMNPLQLLASPDRTHTADKFAGISARVHARRTNVTSFGFPSTYNHGKTEQPTKDKKRVENINYVGRNNHIQFSIKTLSKKLKDAGDDAEAEQNLAEINAMKKTGAIRTLNRIQQGFQLSLGEYQRTRGKLSTRDSMEDIPRMKSREPLVSSKPPVDNSEVNAQLA